MAESDLPAPGPPRRRFRTSLRALMILVLVIAAWLGWRVNRAHTQARAVARIERAGGSVRYDYQFDGTNPEKNLPAPRVPAWIRGPIGDEYFRKVTRVSLFATRQHPDVTDATVAPVADLDRLLSFRLGDAWKITDAGIAHLAGLRRLQEVSLTNMPRITDAGLANLARMTDVRTLILDLGGITDAGIAHLSRLKALRELNLSGDQLTGAGLAHLEGLTGLRILRIGGFHWKRLENDDLAHLSGLTGLRELDLSRHKDITAAGLRHLRGLRQLRKLDLSKTWVSDRAIADLRKEIPGLAVLRVGRPIW